MHKPAHPNKTSHNQPAAKHLLIALAVSLLVRHLLGGLARDGYAWQAHDLAMHLNSCLLTGMLAALVWARNDNAKYIAVGWLGFELISLVESFFTLFKMPRIDGLMFWQVFASLILCAWAYIKAQRKGES